MVGKLHTRKKRYLLTHGNRNRAKRSKTFSSEELAKKYADELKLKKFKVVKVRFGLSKKFKVIEE